MLSNVLLNSLVFVSFFFHHSLLLFLFSFRNYSFFIAVSFFFQPLFPTTQPREIDQNHTVSEKYWYTDESVNIPACDADGNRCIKVIAYSAGISHPSPVCKIVDKTFGGRTAKVYACNNRSVTSNRLVVRNAG